MLVQEQGIQIGMTQKLWLHFDPSILFGPQNMSCPF